jgi:hypothetical protein
MSFKLSGLNPQAYVGVQASTPPQLIFSDIRAPNGNDWRNIDIGTLWLYSSGNVYELWLLVRNTNAPITPTQQAVWVMLYPTSTGITFVENSGSAVPALGILNVLGTGALSTTGSGNTITIALNGTVAESYVTDSGTAVPIANVLKINAGNATNVSGSSVGFTGATNVVQLNVSDSNLNTMIGHHSGNGSISGQWNTALGVNSGNSLTSGDYNVLIGYSAGAALTSPSANTLIGTTVANSLVTGHDNIIIGDGAGANYTTNESSNIILANAGTALETNTIRIGTQGAGSGQQNAAYMAGIYNTSVGGTNQYVIVDNTGKLGSTVVPVNPAAACAFYAYNNADRASYFTDGIFKTLTFNVALFNIGANYNTGTFTFTAPNTGYYSMTMGMSLGGLTDNTLIEFSLQLLVSGTSAGAYLYSNGNPYAFRDTFAAGDGFNQTVFLKMTAGDTAVVQGLVHNVGGTGTALLSGTGGAFGTQYRTIFSGYQVA